MKIKFNNKDYYIKHISADLQYALISQSKNKPQRMLKVELKTIKEINEKDLKGKLKKFITMGSSY